jgi:arginyl-tRNA--protein-N-Asp/Glu arginylyltransferase
MITVYCIAHIVTLQPNLLTYIFLGYWDATCVNDVPIRT